MSDMILDTVETVQNKAHNLLEGSEIRLEPILSIAEKSPSREL